jgi:hypothetical protein
MTPKYAKTTDAAAPDVDPAPVTPDPAAVDVVAVLGDAIAACRSAVQAIVGRSDHLRSRPASRLERGELQVLENDLSTAHSLLSAALVAERYVISVRHVPGAS